MKHCAMYLTVTTAKKFVTDNDNNKLVVYITIIGKIHLHQSLLHILCQTERKCYTIRKPCIARNFCKEFNFADYILKNFANILSAKVIALTSACCTYA